MAQQGVEFELVTAGSRLRILAAVVEGVNVLKHYVETEIRRASSRQHVYAAIDELANNGIESRLFGARFKRLDGLIHELRPTCSHVLLCWWGDGRDEVVILHLVPRSPSQPVGRDAIYLAERRAATLVRGPS